MIREAFSVDVIGNNGGFIRFKNGKIERVTQFNKEAVSSIVKFLKDSNVHFIIHTMGGDILADWLDYNNLSMELALYHTEKTEPDYSEWVQGYKDTFYQHIFSTFSKTTDLLDICSVVDITSFELFPTLQERKVLNFCSKHQSDFEVSKSYLTNLEILPTNTNKMNGIVHYQKKKRVREWIAVGDNENDLQMLRSATQGYLVNNSRLVEELSIHKLASKNIDEWIDEILRKNNEDNNFSI